MMKPFGNLIRRNNHNNDHPPKQAEQENLERPAVSAPPTLHMLTWVRKQSPESISSEFHMTIRTKVSNLTSKQASMLLMVCNVLALRDGLDLTLYLSMEFLTSFLTRSGTILPEEIVEEKHRKSVLLSDILLTSFRGEWLDLEERIEFPMSVKRLVGSTGWLPDIRTFNSWATYWEPNRFLEFRIVPVEALRHRSGFSEPYSSYCKGYGESAHGGRQKTPYSADLDGEPWSESEPPEINLLEVQQYQAVLTAIEAEKAKRIQGRDE